MLDCGSYVGGTTVGGRLTRGAETAISSFVRLRVWVLDHARGRDGGGLGVRDGRGEETRLVRLCEELPRRLSRSMGMRAGVRE